MFPSCSWRFDVQTSIRQALFERAWERLRRHGNTWDGLPQRRHHSASQVTPLDEENPLRLKRNAEREDMPR
jgi:hypothetical protein